MQQKDLSGEVRNYVDQAVGGLYKGQQNILAALRNRAHLSGAPSVHVPGQATITAVVGIRLTAQSSGLFLVGLSAQASQAAAADAITWTVTSYTDAVVGTPLTLPANAAATGVNCYVDNSGAGIAPSAGASGGTLIAAQTAVLGTLAQGSLYTWSGIVGLADTAIAKGSTFYITLSITGTAAARDVVSDPTLSAFELP